MDDSYERNPTGALMMTEATYRMYGAAVYLYRGYFRMCAMWTLPRLGTHSSVNSNSKAHDQCAHTVRSDRQAVT